MVFSGLLLLWGKGIPSDGTGMDAFSHEGVSKAVVDGIPEFLFAVLPEKIKGMNAMVPWLGTSRIMDDGIVFFRRHAFHFLPDFRRGQVLGIVFIVKVVFLGKTEELAAR